jgi:hypothetical protein
MKKLIIVFLVLISVSFDSQKPEAYDTGEWFKFRIHYGIVTMLAMPL